MAAKIKDGLFIGDAETSQSEDFINENKISNLINLSGREVPNIWATHGLVYMTFNWEDKPDFKLGLSSYKKNPDKCDFISDIVEFIDVSIKHGISVLLFSRNGTGRCAVAACIYLMAKYKWGFEKAYEYVYSKKADISLNRGFIQQLFNFDKHLLMMQAKPEKQQIILNSIKQESQDPSSILSLIASSVLSREQYMRWREWDPAYLTKRSADIDYDNDELLLINGYVNSVVTINSLPGPYRAALDFPKPTKLKFHEFLHNEMIYSQFPQDIRPEMIKGILKAGPKEKGKNAHAHVSLDARQSDDFAPSRGGSSNGASSNGRAPSGSKGGGSGGSGNGASGSINMYNPNRELNEDDISDVSSQDVGSPYKPQIGDYYSYIDVEPKYGKLSAQNPQSDDLYGFVGVQKEGGINGSGSGNGGMASGPSSSGAAGASNKYQFAYSGQSQGGYLGGATGPSHSAASSAAVAASAASSAAQAKNGFDRSQPITAEERLKSLMAGLVQPPAQPQGRQSQVRHSYDPHVSSAQGSRGHYSQTADYGKEDDDYSLGQRSNYHAQFDSSASIASLHSSTPSLHELANMHISAQHYDSYGGSRPSNSRAAQPQSNGATLAASDAFDPLRAFEQMQRSGVVRASHDVMRDIQPGRGLSGQPSSAGQTAAASGAGSSRSQVRKGGWMEDSQEPQNMRSLRGSAGQTEGARPSPRFASPQLRQSQQSQQQQPQPQPQQQPAGTGASSSQRTYRQGSPAPRIQSRIPGSATGNGAAPSTATMGTVPGNIPGRVQDPLRVRTSFDGSEMSRGGVAPPRSSSPMTQRIASATTNPPPGYMQASQRKSSSASIRTVNSNDVEISSVQSGNSQSSGPRRVGTSPMRPPTVSASAPNGYDSTTKRYASPSVRTSAGSNPAPGSSQRSGTPTRGWRY